MHMMLKYQVSISNGSTAMSNLPLTLNDCLDMSPPQNVKFHEIHVYAKLQIYASSSLKVRAV